MSGKRRNKYGGNLFHEDRKMHFFRDGNGKITGYGTTGSITEMDDDGNFVIIPTIIDGQAPVSREQAMRHYRETGEFWAKSPGPKNDTREEYERAAKVADSLANDIHNDGAAERQRVWNEYILNHFDEMSDDIRSDEEIAKEWRRRNGMGIYDVIQNMYGNGGM